MAYICVDCGFKGKDNWALNDHKMTDKHKLIVGSKLVDKLELQDIRLMSDDDAKTYIHRHRYFTKEYSPGLTEYHRRKDIYEKNKKILEASKSKMSMTEKAALKKQISEEYSTDDDCDEKNERLRALDYDHEDINRIQDEMQEFMVYWTTGEGKKHTNSKALAEAEDFVRKRMLLELESVNVAKAKNDKKRALYELKMKEYQIKNDID